MGPWHKSFDKKKMGKNLCERAKICRKGLRDSTQGDYFITFSTVNRNILNGSYLVGHSPWKVTPQAAQALYVWVRASEVIWSEYTRIISVLSDAK